MTKACDTYNMAKSDHGPYPGLLKPLPIPSQAWSHTSMDFIEGLPNSAGKNTILVVVDMFTKYSHFISLSHPFTARKMVKLFLDNI